MSATTRVGTAGAAGYVLGRFKKMRMALIVGSALANRNVRAAGIDLIRGSSDGPRSPLVEAGRSALVGAAASRMDRFSDRLHERSSALTGEEDEPDEPDEPDEGEPDDAEEPDEDEYDDEYDDEDDDLDDDEDESERSPRRRRATAPGRS